MIHIRLVHQHGNSGVSVQTWFYNDDIDIRKLALFLTIQDNIINRIGKQKYNHSEYSSNELMDPINIAILGFLLDADKHGYELFKEITDEAGFGVIYTIKIGRLYALLNRLEDEHLVTSSIHTEGARPPKKIFSITEAGRRIFENWMMKPVRHGREIRINLLMKFYFAEKKDIFQEDQIIDNQIRECNTWLESLNQSSQNKPENDQFRYLVEQFRKSQIEGYISWLHWCKERTKDD